MGHMAQYGQLPKKRRLARFDEFLRRIERKVILDDSASYNCVGVRWYGLGAFVREQLLGMDITRKQQWIIKAGDVVYNKLFAWKGSFGVVPTALDRMFVSDKFPTYELDRTRVDERFLRWYFRCPPLWEEARGMSTGSAALSKLTLNPPKFLLLTMPFPPLPEQQRIVARIEEVARSLEEAHNLRRQAAAETDALAGKMASDLFAQWIDRESVEAVAEVRGGIQRTPDRAPAANPVRYLTVAHVQRNRILTGDARFFEVTPSELERWRLLAGDVLIIEGNGSAEQIGRTALFRGEIEDCVHQNHIIRIRPNPKRLDSEFLNAFLNSPAGQDAVQAQSRTTSGLRTLSVGRIRRIRVPIPPLVQQRRLVSELAAHEMQIDGLKHLQAETAAELDALLQAILDRAFRGEL